MNPLLYKAHPMLWLTIDLIINPAAHTWAEAGRLASVYLVTNLLWAAGLSWVVRKTSNLSMSFLTAYCVALPGQVLYLPLMLTLLGDVLAHQFHFADRFIAVFAIVVASQMLGGFYAVAIRFPRSGMAIGLVDGVTVSLFMWLLSLPIGLGLLWLGPALKIY